MELINLIIVKKNWEKKIENKDIIKKWEKELEKQNVKPIYLKIVIDLLKIYKTTKESSYEADDSYRWPINLNVDLKDVSIVSECKCKCCICQQKEYLLNDTDDDSEELEKKVNLIEEKCQCQASKLKKKKMNYLLKFLISTHDLITPEIKKSFKTNVKTLENNEPIDFHPLSNNQVIDLVHPSLYCYVEGVTKLSFKAPRNVLFQWLPAEFYVYKNKVEFDTYINNLNREKYNALYDDISNILYKFVPKFNKLLKTLQKNKKIKEYVPLKYCQVIVKMSNTVLTPESSVFQKGSWHLEGLPCEKIIATGIYYYKMKNITKNYLNFRATNSNISEIDYAQNCYRYVDKHYGFEELNEGDSDNNQGTIINLGSIETTEDLCLVFPNLFQHQVSEFELVDKNKKGVRKILVFFLIDPFQEILSTKHIKPQQNIISLEDAKIYRELLMFQRKFNISDQNKFYTRGWSLCEH